MGEYLVEMWGLAAAGEKQGIFFFIAVYASVTLGYSIVYQLRVAKWPETEGVLLAAAANRVGGTNLVVSHRDYVSKALYAYAVGGVSYQGSRISPWVMMASYNARFVLERQIRKIEKNENGSVRVFYNASDPSKSFLIKPGGIGIVVTAILALGPALLYWLNFHA